ncbi:unnamed protein product [Paramecium sonneborni]|uniref:Uncharacterized protein n=1 Tax=Paramecium sonneborni TaxID=65129 RepID=A0A8S1RLZ4_9CILI|nr:unnamed protein product [Paramecium sonneborni]
MCYQIYLYIHLPKQWNYLNPQFSSFEYDKINSDLIKQDETYNLYEQWRRLNALIYKRVQKNTRQQNRNIS